MDKARKVLVTGGAGFIGSNLVNRLASENFDINIIDDFSTGVKSNLIDLDCKIYEGSILDKDLLRVAMSGVEAVFHLAARGSVPRSIANPQETLAVNINGTINVCEMARSRSIPIIFTSSSSVYGANLSEDKNEEAWQSPLNPYAASKLAAESILISYSRSFNLPTSVYRLFNVYGPGQRPEHIYSAVIPKWIWAAIHNSEINVFGDGKSSRDFTYVENVTEILCQTLLNNCYFDGVVNLAFGRPVSLNEVLAQISNYFPKLNITFMSSRQGDIKYSNNTSNKIKLLFPQILPVEINEGIEKTIDWLNENKKLIINNPLLLDS